MSSRGRALTRALRSLFVVALATLGASDALAQCARTLRADVVALDQPFFWNRLGAVQPQGMMFALRRDVVSSDSAYSSLTPGNVQLREGKRPRPLVLRMNVGDCLSIQFQNLLASSPVHDQQPATRTASIRALGLQLVNSIASDGSNVGQNASSLVAPGGSATYTFYAEREGSHLLYSSAATTGGEGDGGSINSGLFGAVTVQPRQAEWYRSQVTNADLALATTGTTPGGQPIVNYNAVYPTGHALAGLPVLKILNGTEIVHSDLTALITGPNAGRFPAGTYPPNPATPDRNQPFREFTIIYHDEIGAVQAFAEFEDPVLSHTLHSARDAFAINYGAAGAGAEVLANRFGVGPMHDCTECKYEEFFLSSWTVGDPAMVVDVPANAPCDPEDMHHGNPCSPTPGPKATKVFYPEDPSNVYHSYLGDHVKFRILHAGSKEHHVHHQHAHQWLLTPDSDNSNYLDSQAIGPGASYTLEMTYNGSGNRNQTPGDSIFHCHFYPHFAQGMWALWRVHDVFESGSPLDGDGRPTGRALPDGEIAAGTPIPAMVPLPTLGMPPMPQAAVTIVNGQTQINGAGNPGFPFFVPAVAGHRPPKPPLDTIDDGGLPRHIIVDGTFVEKHTRLDFSKDLLTADARAIPETGTPVEVAAMNFHAQRTHSTFKPDGSTGTFTTNGRPAVAGAPIADPCVDDAGNAVGVPRMYKAAVIQLDLKLNKAGWHYPQQRIEALWDDVAATKNGTRAPEPFFFRANSNDCISFWHTVLTPHYYELDDFQVRTPTDVMGQHIHLVKFDVLASDGAGNGFNYEDGTFAPDEVLERIHAINELGGLQGASGRTTLTAKAHPFFGTLGAQTTVQRWYADRLLNNAGKDRTLRTVFSHDHFGPSTHQQAGLYAGLVVEPENSVWRNPVTGATMGSRFDGGPTSWAADILTPNTADSFREFLLQIADFQLAYKPNNTFPDPANVINPPAKKEVGLPKLLEKAPDCPGGVALPCPEAFSADDPGTMAVNYRNEPLALRVRDPNSNSQASGLGGDLSHAFRSNITRADADFNKQPNFYPPLTPDVGNGDPFTPLMRAYQNDKVQIRMLVGAHEEGHNFTMNGLRWLTEPSERNSGYRNSQMMGISEHFEFVLPSSREPLPNPTDYLYRGASTDDLWNGVWGLMRVFDGKAGIKSDLKPLPNNPTATSPQFTNFFEFSGICPIAAPIRNYTVVATTAAQAGLPGGTLTYNGREGLHDPTAVLYFRSTDLDSKGKLKAGIPVEPLILRANAGDCLMITLQNKLPATLADLAGYSTLPMIVENFNNNDIKPSSHVGLHPQMLTYFNWTSGDGMNVGNNLVATAAPGGSVSYQWYAGAVDVLADGRRTATPIEFGATNLMPADPIKQGSKGAIGTLIIEPKGSTWVEDATMRAAATVTTPSAQQFREFVLVFQNDVNLRHSDGSAVKNTAEAEDPEDSGQKALNYRTEPFWARMNFAPETPLETTRTFDFTNVLSNSQVGGDPVTPVFTAKAGVPVRFRVVHPSGKQRNNVFTVHGHGWQRSPYVNNSTAIGSNPLSEWTSAEMGIGPSAHLDAPIAKAGGVFLVQGDYLYRTFQSFQFDGGMWGIFRVTP